MHIYILVHKGAGSSRGTKVLAKLLDVCSKKNIVASVFVTEYKGHAISLIPVSYTHLDVYKRQSLFNFYYRSILYIIHKEISFGSFKHKPTVHICP